MRNLLFILSFFAILSVVAVTPSKSDVDKSDYLFLEAKQAQAADNNTQAYLLLEKAYALNPDPDIAGELWPYVLGKIWIDSTAADRTMQLLETYCENNTDDYNAWNTLATFTSQIKGPVEGLKVYERVHAQFPDRDETTYMLAQTYAENERFSESLALLDTLETRLGRSTQFTGNKVQIYYQMKDTAGIERELQSLLATSPSSVDYNIFAGNILNALKRTDALEYFDRACELEPTNGLAVYSRANYFNEQGDSTRFRSEITRALSMDDLDVETKLSILKSYIIQGSEADTTGSLPQADDLFEKLVELYPHEHDIHMLYAQYILGKDTMPDYVMAANHIATALDMKPDDEQEWRMLASIWYQVDSTSAAVEVLEKAVRHFPEDASLHMMLGGGYAELQQNHLAMEQADVALAHADSTDFPMLSDILGLKGNIYMNTEQPDSALKYFNQALVYSEPSDLMLRNNLAYLLATQNQDLDRALKLIEEVMEAPLDDTSASTYLDTYAWVLFRMKDYDKARTQIDKAIELDPQPSEELYHHAGDIYFMDGEPEQAVTLWQKALKLSPDNDLLKRKVKYKTYFYK